MNPDTQMSDTDSEFKQKVFVIADEVLNILKEFSRGDEQHISSKAIAERMFWKDSITSVLTDSNRNKFHSDTEAECLRELSGIVMENFTDVVPSHISDKIRDLKIELHGTLTSARTRELLESPITIIRKYASSMSARNSELEDFLRLTMEYLSKTENNLKSNSEYHYEKFDGNRNLEKALSADIINIKQDFDITDLESVKASVFSKIERINRGIDQKRVQDVKRLKEAEKTIEEMSWQISDIKREADELRRMTDEMEFDSIRDSLTGLYNRRTYNDKVRETLANLKRYGVPSCLILCDVDNFKIINDKFGHRVGDLALKKLAALLKKRLRNTDFISRYGGEEFAVILPHTDLLSAVKVGEGIREYIDRSAFYFKGDNIPVKISVGVSSFSKEGDGGSVFEKADSALLLAKRSGKNQVKSEIDLNTDYL